MTAPTIPTYLVGRNLAVFGLQLLGTNASGVVTPGAVYDFKALGVFDSFEFQGTLESEDIHSGDAQIANYTPKYDDWTVTVTEVIPATGNSNLYSIWNSTMYLRVACQSAAPAYISGGTAAPGLQFVAWGIRGEITYGVVEGKNVARLTIKPCGVFPFFGSGTPPI